MLDEDYDYLAKRYLVEQNLVRTAKCCASSDAHQALADAYLVRLQAMILSPARYRSEMSWKSREEWLLAQSTQVHSDPKSSMRILPAGRG